MTKPAKVLFEVIGPRSLSRFDARCENPMQEQEKLLLKLLSENAETVFGRRHGFESIQSFSGFQKQIPISEYDDLEQYIEAARRGELDQLTHEKPVFYAKTSGTTGAAKYIPVTETSRKAKSRLMRVWLAGLFRDHPAILDGKVLQIASPEVEEYAPDGTPCGAEAGHAYRNMPRVMRGMYPVPYEVSEIDEYQDRYYTLLRIAVMHSITTIGTPNPSTILLLARHLEQNTERILRDVRDGTLDAGLDLPDEIRDRVEDLLEPDPERASFLEKAASAGGGQLLPREIWPGLEVLACWKGGTVGPYFEQMKRYYPEDLPIRDLGWLSSECRGSIPLQDDGDSGALAVATNIYEFHPADAGELSDPTTLLTIDQVEEGRRYFAYITTTGGLYRYPMHDILEVTGFHRRTPCIRFVQKEKGIVSFTGEKLTETQVLAAAGEVLNGEEPAGTFVAAIGRPADSDQDDPSYLFLVEYGSPPGKEVAEQTARALDEALAKQNTEYASKRKSGRLAPAALRILEPGQFEAYEQRALREGARDGQFKVMRLTDDVDFIEHFDRVVGEYQAS